MADANLVWSSKRTTDEGWRVRVEYEKLKPRYEVISQIIEERNAQRLTQEEWALRVGAQKSNISRFESGSYNPSLDFVVKVAKDLGKEVHIEIR